MAVIFKGRTKQDRLDLFPNVPLAFEDENAERYFVAAGFADETDEEPEVTYPVGSVNIDPATVHSTGSAAPIDGMSAGDRVLEG